MLFPILSCVFVGSFELCRCLHTLHLEYSLFLLFLFLPMPRKATPHNYLQNMIQAKLDKTNYMTSQLQV